MLAQEPESPLKDKNYNLISVLQQSLENAWRLDSYIRDAENDGDEELARWLRTIQDNNKKAGEQGKQLLHKRLIT